jgi:hypothetical protein
LFEKKWGHNGFGDEIEFNNDEGDCKHNRKNQWQYDRSVCPLEE